MRFAGQAMQPTPVRDKPIVPGFNAEDLKQTPEMTPGPYYPGQDLMRDKYIRHNPKSGVAVVPRVDEYGRRIDPNKPPIPEIPRNRNNEQKPGVDVWVAPVRKA